MPSSGVAIGKRQSALPKAESVGRSFVLDFGEHFCGSEETKTIAIVHSDDSAWELILGRPKFFPEGIFADHSANDAVGSSEEPTAEEQPAAHHSRVRAYSRTLSSLASSKQSDRCKRQKPREGGKIHPLKAKSQPEAAF